MNRTSVSASPVPSAPAPGSQRRAFVRAAGSLALHLAAALALIVALEPLLHGPNADRNQDAIAHTRGVALAVALIAAVMLWALPDTATRIANRWIR